MSTQPFRDLGEVLTDVQICSSCAYIDLPLDCLYGNPDCEGVLAKLTTCNEWTILRCSCSDDRYKHDRKSYPYDHSFDKLHYWADRIRIN